MVPGQALAVANISAEKPEELSLQAGQARGKECDFREREPTQLDAIKRDRIAGIAFAVDGAQANDLAGEVESKDLFTPFAIDPARLDRAATYCSDCIEGVAFAKHVRSGLQWPDMFD